MLSVFQNWPVHRSVLNGMYQFGGYPSSSNFFKIARTIFGVIIFQDFAAPSLQNDAFDLQTGQSGQPVLTKGVRSQVAFL